MRGGGPFDGNLAWVDDHVRMVQVLDWINGPGLLSGWYDHTLHRANAPEGFHTLWARLVDVPIAAIIIILQGWIGQYRAAMTASILMPLIQTFFLFQASAYLAAPLVGKQNARLVTLFVLFSSCINAENFTLAGFQLGAVGHHAWYVIFTILMCGAAVRLTKDDDPKSIIIAGLSIAVLLAIGIEAIPLIGGLCATLALVSPLYNRSDIAKRAVRFTAIGAMGGFILLPAYQPPDQWLNISFAEPSALGPLLVACAALFFIIQFFMLKKFGQKKIHCFCFFIALAAVFLAALIHFFPQTLEGPAAALSPEERKIAAIAHTEAMPLLKVAANKLDFIRLVIPLLVAIIYGTYRAKTALTRKDAALYSSYVGFALVPFGMTLALSRYYHHAIVMACPLLTLVLLDAWKQLPKNRVYYLNGFLIFLALGPLWTLLIPAAAANVPFGTDVLLFPSKRQSKDEICDVKSLSVFLNSHYGTDRTIMVPMYRSAEFLFNTHMKIFFLANFPSNNKFRDVEKFYKTPSSEEAHTIALSQGIDLVATCKLGSTRNPFMLNPAFAAQAASFNQQLLDGPVPGWLAPVAVSMPTPYLLFEVKH